jgi:succinate dehydrogenase hydrophobic anchor subunit
MSRLSAEQKIQPHWWVKTMAGLILGLTFSYALVAIYAWYGPGGIDAVVKSQFNMWMISPIWMLVLSFSYLFKTGLKAVIYLTCANLVAYGIYFFLRGFV